MYGKLAPLPCIVPRLRTMPLPSRLCLCTVCQVTSSGTSLTNMHLFSPRLLHVVSIKILILSSNEH